MSLCRCSAAFQITEKTHQTLRFGFAPSRAVCCFLMKPVHAFMESVLVSVCVVSSSISRVDSRHLSNLSASRRCFYRYCLFCFSGAAKGKLVLTRLVNLTLKLIMYLNPLCYVRLPKAFEGIIWGNRGRGGARCTRSSCKSRWADGATLDISPTVQSYNLKHEQSHLQIHSRNLVLVRRKTWRKKKFILSSHVTQVSWNKKKKPHKKSKLGQNLLLP